MYQISDCAETYITTDDLQLAFYIASRNSFDTPLFVTNTTNGHEVTLSMGRVVGDNITTHNHGQPNANGPVCTILNCGN